MGIDPLYLFVFAGLFSPGPNVLLLTASGARFGFWRTIPHILGVAIGVGVIAGVTGLGIGALLQANPRLEFGLKVLASAWILWMAWKLWHSVRATRGNLDDRPFGFIRAVLFQWVNPKVWAVTLTASSAYSIGLPPVGQATRLAFAFSGINIFVCIFWTFAGTLLAYLLASPTAWQYFIRIMAAALAIAAGMVFL